MSIVDDLRYARRSALRSLGLSCVVVGTFSLGIGATSAIFSAVNGVLLAPLPYRGANGLVAVTYASADPHKPGRAVPSAVYRQWLGRSKSIEAITYYSIGPGILRMPTGERSPLSVAAVSSNFFRALGAPLPAAGREIGLADEPVEAPAVAMLSYGYCTTNFGDPGNVIGRNVLLNGVPVTVVGVTAPAFRFPAQSEPDVVSLSRLPENDSMVRFVNVIGRLRGGFSIDNSEKELTELLRSRKGYLPPSVTADLARGASPRVTDLRSAIVGRSRGGLLLLMAATVSILLLACMNIASLLLSKSIGREREWSVRIALGAKLRHLAQSLVVESLMLATVGGCAGLLILALVLNSLRSSFSAVLPRSEVITIDRHVLLFSAAAVILTALGCTLIPLVRILSRETQVNMSRGLVQAIRTALPRRWLNVLVAGQASVATILLVIGLLLLMSLRHVTGFGLGFSPNDVLTFKVPAIGLGDTQTRRTEIVYGLLDWIRSQPGVMDAGMSSSLPMAGHAFRFSVPVEGSSYIQTNTEDGPGVDVVSPGYLSALRIPLVAGRDFVEDDRAESPQVAIVNRSFARIYALGMNPLGRRISLGGTIENVNIAIVGVVEDSRDGNPSDPARPTIYRPLSQAGTQMVWHTASFAVRVPPPATGLIASIRQSLKTTAPAAVVYDAYSMDSRLMGLIAPQRFWTLLFVFFAVAGVLLAGTGVYGVLTYCVSLDMRELGIRLAIGASVHDLRLLIMQRALLPTARGMLLGLGSGYLLSRTFRGMLFGVDETNWTAYLAASAVVTAVALLAVSAPAHRAASIEPNSVLRSDQ